MIRGKPIGNPPTLLENDLDDTQKCRLRHKSRASVSCVDVCAEHEKLAVRAASTSASTALTKGSSTRFLSAQRAESKLAKTSARHGRTE